MEIKMVRLSDGRQRILNLVESEDGIIKILVFELADNGFLGTLVASDTLRFARPIREYPFETKEEAFEWLKIFEDGADASLLP